MKKYSFFKRFKNHKSVASGNSLFGFYGGPDGKLRRGKSMRVYKNKRIRKFFGY